ncbi:MAG: sugar phosphate nucleotidyltransferase [bacterium]
MNNLYVCIMAGGSGERFWPLSRRAKPKHLLRLFSGQTLLEQTVRRLNGLIANDRIFVLTNEAQWEGIKAALPDIDPARILAEPAKRDTAPAAALATALALKKNPEAIIALLPADAMIADVASFQRQLNDAAELAEDSGALVTISIRPTWPSTGFGYLELGASAGQGKRGSKLFEARRFVEKPDAAKAAEYVQSGQYGWNAGIFIWKASVFQQEAVRLQPGLAHFIQTFVEAADEKQCLQQMFPALPKISVDYAIMEKAKKVMAVEAEFDWDDVGAWTALPAHLGKDAQDNTFRGAVTAHNARNNIAINEGKTIALCGVQDLVVIATDDAVLVCHRDAVQDVKKILPLLPPEIQ